MIALLIGLLAAGYFWAKHTQLDLITRGEGRLIAEGQNKLVQAPDGGIITLNSAGVVAIGTPPAAKSNVP